MEVAGRKQELEGRLGKLQVSVIHTMSLIGCSSCSARKHKHKEATVGKEHFPQPGEDKPLPGVQRSGMGIPRALIRNSGVSVPLGDVPVGEKI